ncbi:MAG: Holliday junction resolvase RuvX [Defluviitaleaceae bacterium]|nr:Holliday junction resolvase RuvX [Defluviitaleaceae bacterium]
MNILGIDYGDNSIGLAIADNILQVATPLKAFKEKTMRLDVDYIAKVCENEAIEKIVIGLPKNMDGSEGERASKTRSFGNALQKVTGLEIIYKDERLSTAQAKQGFSAFYDNFNIRTANTTAKKSAKKSGELDTASAQIILQSYLDGLRFL